MAKQDKEHFAGAKTVWLHFVGLQKPVLITYPSSITLHKAVKASKGEIDPQIFSVWDGSNRISYHTKDIRAFIFPRQELNRKTSKIFLNFAVVFEDGYKFEVTIANVERMRIVYKQLEPMIGKTVSNSDLWLVIPQEQNKFAYVKYSSPILYISSNIVETKNED